VTVSPDRVRRMFGRIARRYDLINSLLSLGQHRRWKRLTARACRVPPGGLALDVCAGTADIALALTRLDARAVALDFCAPMLALARRKAVRRPVAFLQADALSLPLADNTFHAAAVGFSLRNVSSIPDLLAEMTRVVRPGGWVVSLETSQPTSAVIRAFYRAYLEIMVLLSAPLSEGPAYRYFLSTIIAFPPADRVADLFRAAGLRDVSCTLLTFGAAALHAGRVPA
jgi:demethylmenaquinone methyltransferase/2-methoxy-6-polyprenyl-1,4-benzoquinol methylase